MIRFAATCFDGQSSLARPATVEVEGETVRVCAEAAPPSEYPLQQCRLTSVLGSSPPALLLPDGGRCESDDREALAAFKNPSWGQRLVVQLERRWALVLLCLVLLVFCSWLLIDRGIPLLADRVSQILPAEVNETLTAKVLDIMDRGIFQPSELSEEQKEALRALFAEVAGESTAPFSFRLDFRNSPQLGANAFALPDGLVIVTDGLVELAEENRELSSIFVHERAHVENRHALRSLLQNASAFFLISALVGDIASVTSTAATLPTLLLETGYSRAFERKADQAIADYFRRHNWSTAPAVSILEKLAASSPDAAELSLLSTHPLTRDRLLFLRQADIQGYKKD